MLRQHGFPPEVQKWIIGRRIPKDNETLSRCGVKTTGESIHLYLLQPKSVHMTKDELVRKYGRYLSTGQCFCIQEIHVHVYM